MVLPSGWRCRLSLGLELTSFLITTLLLSWGVFVLLFLVLGGFSLDGMMRQLANFSRRYVAADAGRLLAFHHLLLAAHLAVSLIILIIRRTRLAAMVRRGRSNVHA